MLDDVYYQALQSGKRVIDGITVVDERLLIPFKARAFLDLSERLKSGDKIDAKDIRKHRNDVFRLIQLLPEDATIELPDAIRHDLREFVKAVADDATLDPKSFDVAMTRQQGIELLRSAYRLD